MEFQYPFMTTGIGSFPHRNEEEVFRLIFKNFPEAPFWPQLPKRSFLEGMVVQYSEGFPCLRWNEKEQKVWIETSQGFEKEIERFYQRFEENDFEPFQITEDFARGLRILRDLSSKDHRKKMKYIKGQITGPITFGLALADQEQKPIFYDPSLRDILVKHLSLKARWLEKKYDDLFPSIPPIIFFDEPSLSSFGSAFSGLNREDVIRSLNECFDAVKGLKGSHCCGNTDWSVLLSTHLDVLSFDAYDYFETLSLYPKDLRVFLERGGILAWGIIPTSEAVIKEDAQSLVNRFKEGIKALSKKGIDPTLLQRAIITPSCGMASLSVPLAEKVCRLTADVSKRLRDSFPGS
ncbi:MAG TPA: methionine synthase [Thermodesulfobacteriota bacterium]|nr:methionine synthase [Thermodesulfobacteriota bacterium]